VSSGFDPYLVPIASVPGDIWSNSSKGGDIFEPTGLGVEALSSTRRGEAFLTG
jgi:hypothetical protein